MAGSGADLLTTAQAFCLVAYPLVQSLTLAPPVVLHEYEGWMVAPYNEPNLGSAPHQKPFLESYNNQWLRQVTLRHLLLYQVAGQLFFIFAVLGLPQTVLGGIWRGLCIVVFFLQFVQKKATWYDTSVLFPETWPDDLERRPVPLPDMTAAALAVIGTTFVVSFAISTGSIPWRDAAQPATCLIGYAAVFLGSAVSVLVLISRLTRPGPGVLYSLGSRVLLFLFPVLVAGGSAYFFAQYPNWRWLSCYWPVVLLNIGGGIEAFIAETVNKQWLHMVAVVWLSCGYLGMAAVLWVASLKLGCC